MFIYHFFGWKRLTFQTGIVLQDTQSARITLYLFLFYLLIKYFLFPGSLSPSNDAEKCLLFIPVSEIHCPGISGTHFHTLDNDFLSFDMITLGLDRSWNLLNLNILFSGSVFAVKRFPLRHYV